MSPALLVHISPMRYLSLLLVIAAGSDLAAQGTTATYVAAVDAWLARSTRIEPPPAYRTWWSEIAAECECRVATDFSEVQFYSRPGRTFSPPRTSRQSVAHWPGSTVVVIAEHYLDDERVVKHEMLHVLLEVNGHPPIFGRLGLRAEDLRLH